MYETKHSTEFDKAELSLYEEVTKMPPLKRRTIALVGCQGVGRRTLKSRLINSNPDKFAAVIPCKSDLFIVFTNYQVRQNNYNRQVIYVQVKKVYIGISNKMLGRT